MNDKYTKKLTPAQELAILLAQIAAELHVDAQRRDIGGDESADVAVWETIYDGCAALRNRLLHGVE